MNGGSSGACEEPVSFAWRPISRSRLPTGGMASLGLVHKEPSGFPVDPELHFRGSIKQQTKMRSLEICFFWSVKRLMSAFRTTGVICRPAAGFARTRIHESSRESHFELGTSARVPLGSSQKPTPSCVSGQRCVSEYGMGSETTC